MSDLKGYGDNVNEFLSPNPLPAPSSLPRFIAIDGLRAWMAWFVVLTHVVQQALPSGGPPRWVALDLGGEAVSVFIIISGFVITHLLIERPTRYSSYIIARFMRLFPAFVVCAMIGGVSYVLADSWADRAWFAPLHGEDYNSLTRFLWSHVISHFAMLHGLIPNTLLPRSQYAFLPPGWSVSLEWQFYLIAPLVVWACRKNERAVGLVLAVVACGLVYHLGLKDLWERPSFLPGAAKFFLVGIGCRFVTPAMAGLVQNVAAVGLGLAYTALWVGSPAVAVWLLVFSFLLRAPQTSGWIDRFVVASMRVCLEGKAIQFLAERSYSTYLLHWPIIMMIGALATRNGVAPGVGLAIIMLASLPLTLMLQEPIYRFVEVPGRKLGRTWSRKLAGA